MVSYISGPIGYTKRYTQAKIIFHVVSSNSTGECVPLVFFQLWRLASVQSQYLVTLRRSEYFSFPNAGLPS